MERIEITFDKIHYCYLANILQFLNNVPCDQSLLSSPYIENINKNNILSNSNADEFMVHYHFINAFLFKTNFPSISIRVLIYQGEIEINISLDKADLCHYSEQRIISKIKILAKLLATSRYYVGYEPAQDRETQFFSYQGKGPLLW